MSKCELTYWERQAIRKVGMKLELESFSSHLEAILLIEGEDAYREAILSEKPLKGCVVHDPRPMVYTLPALYDQN